MPTTGSDREGSEEQKLREHVIKLEKELKHSKAEYEQQLASARPFILHRDKKIKPFSPKDDVEEWVENVIHYLERFKSESEKREFVLDHIEKEPKVELKLHMNIERESVLGILSALREVFGTKDTVVQLQQNFFCRNQSFTESIEEYSYALMNLALRMQKMKPSYFSDIETVLKEKFAEGVYEKSLKRELRRLNKEMPKLRFWELRDRANGWCSAYPEESPQTEAVAASNDPLSSKVFDMLEKQEKTISVLTESLQQRLHFSDSGSRSSSWDRGRRRGRGISRGGARDRAQSSRDTDVKPQDSEGKMSEVSSPVICHYCKGLNHFARNCLKKRQDIKLGKYDKPRYPSNSLN